MILTCRLCILPPPRQFFLLEQESPCTWDQQFSYLENKSFSDDVSHSLSFNFHSLSFQFPCKPLSSSPQVVTACADVKVSHFDIRVYCVYVYNIHCIIYEEKNEYIHLKKRKGLYTLEERKQVYTMYKVVQYLPSRSPAWKLPHTLEEATVRSQQEVKQQSNPIQATTKSVKTFDKQQSNPWKLLRQEVKQFSEKRQQSNPWKLLSTHVGLRLITKSFGYFEQPFF